VAQTTKKRAPSIPRKRKIGIVIGREGGLNDFILPFAIPFGLPILGTALHAEGGQPPIVYWVPGFIMVLGAFVAWVSFHQTAPRRMFHRMHLAGSWFFAIGSLSIHMAIGPGNAAYSHAWAWLWVLAGCAFAASWLTPRFETVRGDGKDDHDAKTKSGLDEMLGVPGAHARMRAKTKFREVWRVWLKDGQDFEDMQKAARAIASRRKLEPGSVRVMVAKVRGRKRADVADVVMALNDPLKGRIDWPGCSAFGESIALPLRTGMYEDGTLVKFLLPGREDTSNPLSAAAVGATIGKQGSGKTQGGNVELVEVISRNDVDVWYIDTAKAQQNSAILGACTYVASTAAQARALLAALNRLIPVRAALLGAHGYKQWQQGCGLRFLYVRIEEAARVIPDSDDFVTLTQAVRSVGIFLDTSQQRAATTTFDSDARFNVGRVKCYGMGDDLSAGMLLPEDVLDSGVAPQLWGNDFPGRHLITAPSIPREKWSMPAKDYAITDGQITDVVQRSAVFRGPLTDDELAAISPAVTKMCGHSVQDSAPTKTTKDVPTMVTDEATRLDELRRLLASKGIDLDELFDDEDDTNAALMMDGDDMRTLMPKPPEPLDGYDGTEPIDTDDEADFRDALVPGDALSYEARVAAFNRIVASLLVAGQGQAVDVCTADFVDAWFAIPGIGASQRPALQRLITRLVEDGGAQRIGHGRYRLESGADRMLEGMTESEDDDDEYRDS
jgi:hypothetical protein